MTTTRTGIPRPRRTFEEVAKEAYERGFAEGMERASKNAEQEWDVIRHTNLELSATINTLRTKLANVSLRKLAWSRITGLFKERTEKK